MVSCRDCQDANFCYYPGGAPNNYSCDNWSPSNDYKACQYDECNNYCKYMPEQNNKTNKLCKKCENWKYKRLWIGYKFCPYCGRALDI